MKLDRTATTRTVTMYHGDVKSVFGVNKREEWQLK